MTQWNIISSPWLVNDIYVFYVLQVCYVLVIISPCTRLEGWRQAKDLLHYNIYIKVAAREYVYLIIKLFYVVLLIQGHTIGYFESVSKLYLFSWSRWKNIFQT